MGLTEKIQSMTALKAGVIGLGIAGAYYILLFNDGGETARRIASTEEELKKMSREISILEGTFTDASRLTKIAEEMGESMNRVAKYIPEKLTDSELVKNLSSAARAVGAKVVSISSKSRVDSSSGLYVEIPVGIELVGTYGQMMSFLAQLTQGERIYTVKNMSYATYRGESRTSGSEVKLSATVVGYTYIPSKEEKEEKEGEK